MSQGPSRIDAISSRWSLMDRAHFGSTITGGQARQALTMRYMPAVRRYVSALMANAQDAEDLAQDVALRLLAGDFAGASPERGRFRQLLKVAVRNMAKNYWAKKRRRRHVDLDPALIGADDPGSQCDDSWDAAWRSTVLDHAWNRLQKDERAKSGSVAYTLLRLRTEHPSDTSEQLAQRLSNKIGKPIRPDAVRQQLRRARLRFADLLIEEVAAGVDSPNPEKIEDELLAMGLLDFVRELVPAAPPKAT